MDGVAKSTDCVLLAWWLQSKILTTAPVAEVPEESKKVQILEEREEIKLVTGHRMRVIR